MATPSADDSFFDQLAEQVGGPNIGPDGNRIAGKREYKVLSSIDKFWGGRFDARQIESTLNAFAEAGWRVVAVCTAPIPSVGDHREEILIFLERGS